MLVRDSRSSTVSGALGLLYTDEILTLSFSSLIKIEVESMIVFVGSLLRAIFFLTRIAVPPKGGVRGFSVLSFL